MTKRTIIPIGPYHALQEEPEFFKLHVEGERVVHLDIEIGYNHRGIEKLSESKDFEETIFMVERICGICSTSHPIACVQAIEEAGEIEVPERALFIRSTIGELERLHSHFLWLGLAGHFLGFNTIWMWAWRYREDLLNILELITGNRNHYGLPIMPAEPGYSSATQPTHPHPITEAHKRIYRENNLVGALNLAVDLEDPVRIRELVATYRDEYPSDDHLLQEGYALIADCLEDLDAATRDRAQRFWNTQIRSQTRRYVRRHCLRPK